MAHGLTMSEFRSAGARDADWNRLTLDCVDQLADMTGANLGFVYLTEPLAGDAPEIIAVLRQRTGVLDWVGSVGVGVCVDDMELFEERALAVMVARLPADSFHLLPVIEGGAANSVLDRQSEEWIARSRPVLGLVHADPRNPNIPDAITALAEETGAFLVGGLSSGRGLFCQVCREPSEGGVSGVLFAPDLTVMTGLSQGCGPIGPMHTITECHQNVIETIDNRPALAVFKEEIGELLARDLRRTAGYIFAALPVPGDDTGDYLVRNVIGVDPVEGWLAIADEVEPGQRVLFVRRDRGGAVKDLDRMLTGLKRRIGDRQPRGAVYISCVARGPNLFGPNSEELRQIRRAIGDVPLVGFFAAGEISHDRLYGYTGILTVFL